MWAQLHASSYLYRPTTPHQRLHKLQCLRRRCFLSLSPSPAPKNTAMVALAARQTLLSTTLYLLHQMTLPWHPCPHRNSGGRCSTYPPLENLPESRLPEQVLQFVWTPFHNALPSINGHQLNAAYFIFWQLVMVMVAPARALACPP